MAERQCDKCGDLVDDAKAFCPGCGQPFVEEQKRTTTSEFESVEHTQQMGQTMYNQMLSDMGLNISKQPNALERKVESVAPVAAPPPPRKKSETITPAATSAVRSAQTPRSNLKWIIIAAAVVLLLALVVVAAAAFVVWFVGRA